MVDSVTSYPIEITFYEDREWSDLQAIRSRFTSGAEGASRGP
jgi:hypothetical protein